MFYIEKGFQRVLIAWSVDITVTKMQRQNLDNRLIPNTYCNAFVDFLAVLQKVSRNIAIL